MTPNQFPFCLSLPLCVLRVAGPFSEPWLMRSLSLPADVERADPHPFAAAVRMATWRGFGRGARERGAAPANHATAAAVTGATPAPVLSGFVARIGGDMLSREAFEALLPCIFHADAVHDEVCGVRAHRSCDSSSVIGD